MASTAAAARPAHARETEVSLLRLYLLRGAYLLLVIGLGATIVPVVIIHEPAARGVIPSLLCGVWLMAFLGLKYPLRMLPLLMFEFAWKAIWLLAFGLAQWRSGQMPPTFADDFPAIVFGVILMPLILPWGYIWRNYVKAAGDHWR
jgi:hypothetical protein